MTGLSLVDVVQLKQNPSRESRLLVAEKVCDQFNTRSLSPEEQMVVTEIFRLLAKDAEVVIRQALAEKLRHNAKLPQDIAFMLASDAMQVALPVLQFSPVLTEKELVMLVRGTTELAKLLAVSKRDVLTSAVSHALVEKQHRIVTESLLHNKGAMIAAEDLQATLQAFSQHESVLSALIAREQLPASVAEQMISLVSGSLKLQLLQKHRQHSHALAEASEDAEESTVMAQVALPSGPAQKEALIDHLYRSQKLNSSLVVRAVCLGDMDFFTTSMMKLTGWKQERIEEAVRTRNVETLRRLYRTAGLPESIQDATLAVLILALEEIQQGHKPGSSAFAGRMIERVVASGYDRSVNNMGYLLTLIGKKSLHQMAH